MAYLFISELVLFLTPEISHEMFVDSPPDTADRHASLQINLNVSMPAMPCAVTSVDAQDIMGGHIVDYGGRLHKTRLDKNGNVKRGLNGQNAPVDGGDPMEQIGEGCLVQGNIVIKRVPGNIHISAHAHAHLLNAFFGGAPERMNVSHIVHNLWFGETTDLMEVETAETTPLKGAKRISYAEGLQQGEGKSYEYFINIVPTQYHKLNGQISHLFQYVANSNEVVGRYKIPAVYFRYELSGVTVKFHYKRKSFAHFLVQICAIIGGVFTVLGLLNSVVHSSLKRFMKKAEINKLG
jgi:hypothetical protein